MNLPIKFICVTCWRKSIEPPKIDDLEFSIYSNHTRESLTETLKHQIENPDHEIIAETEISL